jgi:hypothetical protein
VSPLGRGRDAPQAWRKRTSWPGRSCATASSEARRDDRDHRVAAGHGPVGEQDRRESVAGDLHRSGHRPLARELARAASLEQRPHEPGADAVGVLGEPPSRLEERFARGIREPVGTGAGQQREGDRTAGRRERDVLVDDGHGCRGLDADLQTRPATTGSGPSPASVSLDREPSTTGASMPPRTASTYRMPLAAMPISSTAPSRALAAV